MASPTAQTLKGIIIWQNFWLWLSKWWWWGVHGESWTQHTYNSSQDARISKGWSNLFQTRASLEMDEFAPGWNPWSATSSLPVMLRSTVLTWYSCRGKSKVRYKLEWKTSCLLDHFSIHPFCLSLHTYKYTRVYATSKHRISEESKRVRNEESLNCLTVSSTLRPWAPLLLCWDGRKGLIDAVWQQRNEWNQLIDSLAEEWVDVDVGCDPKKRVRAWAKI